MQSLYPSFCKKNPSYFPSSNARMSTPATSPACRRGLWVRTQPQMRLWKLKCGEYIIKTMRINIKNFITNLPHIHIGIKLHFNYLCASLKGELKKLDYCIAFPSIEEGIKALKRIEKPCISIPIPDEIMEECGIAILCDEENLKPTLEKLGDVKILGIYRRKSGKFTEKISI